MQSLELQICSILKTNPIQTFLNMKQFLNMQYSKYLLIGESVTYRRLQNTGTGYIMFEDYGPFFLSL